ncbi:MAG: insulinase family protein [Cyclobacteriaceae bacterium]|nr:insulinase family protein [Cyclobacteriaceae bacterium]MCX7638067.1 insulinase family protein [Cyclobacteriaceae bacterium]MDW8331932.1 pitrilysin family protein [Cyclobacteriaceae bacterium]
MIPFSEFTLDNGLRVIVHEDPNVEIAVLDVLYDVGARDEHPQKTGFAHLFEHLMFGGSVNIPDYDEPLQMAGGENNAFTSNDITNYYVVLPASNIETAFWLESDRMLGLSFDPKVLDVQRKVVVEEFKQRYLNQPYGDAWLKFRPLAYKVHPYQWATIGKDPSHIEQATMDDVREFFYSHYIPNNAVLVVAGKVTAEQARRLATEWFGPIPSRPKKPRHLPQEPPQVHKQFLRTEAAVPANALYMAWHMPGRFDDQYYPAELLSDLLGRGESSRLYVELVKEKELFTSISAYVTGSIDPGLLVVSGRLKRGITPEQGEEAVQHIITDLLQKGITEKELTKVKNQMLMSLEFEEVEVLNRAINLAFASLSGDTGRVNWERNRYQQLTVHALQETAHRLLTEKNCSVMHYCSTSAA